MTNLTARLSEGEGATWKPTPEMIEIHAKAHYDAEKGMEWDEWADLEENVRASYRESSVSALIAVQHLMYKAAQEEAAWLVERLPENDMETVASAIRAMREKEPQG